MNVIENTTMHAPVVAFFESLGYNDADGGVLRLSEASSLATHATFVHRAAESGTTVDNWFASLAAMGVFEGVMKVGSLPRNIPQQAGQRSMPTTDFSVNERAKPVKSIGIKSVPSKSMEKPRVLPLQEHHFATNKHSKFTPKMQNIAIRYNLDLNDLWNRRKLPHQGRHPHAYHEWVLREMRIIDNMANGKQDLFLHLFDKRIIQPVLNDPDMLRKIFWQ